MSQEVREAWWIYTLGNQAAAADYERLKLAHKPKRRRKKK